MPDLPTGTITFLFTDVEGSTRLWEKHPKAMRAAIEEHLRVLGDAVAGHGGHVFRSVGDGLCAAFATAPDALAAALAAQRGLAAEARGELGPLRVRMALHTGAAEVRNGDYVGVCLNRLGRLLAAGHGGQVLLSQATAGLVREALPAEVGLRDLGEQHLRDLGQAEHVYQLLHPGLPADFPPLRALDALPSNLPGQVTSFVGRERELTAVRDSLLRPDVRLLTLTGPGGVGKTCLARHAASAIASAFPDGVVFVSLAELAGAALVLPTVARAFGVQPGPRALAEVLAELLHARRLLLVLDNWEHVAEAAPAIGTLLAACPKLTILATSRAPLRLAGEHEFAVPLLALPDPEHLPTLGALAQVEAVALFLARAQAVQASFALTRDNAATVAAICRQLDGLPLALELAAARVRLLPPAALLRRLEHRLALLTGGATDLPERQRTLRATLAWSYDLLSPDEQALFRRLGVFTGGATLEMAERVATAAGSLGLDLLDGLDGLVRHSLLRQEEHDGEPRFLMLETVREFALEQLALAGEVEATRDAHVEALVRWLDGELGPEGWDAEGWGWTDRSLPHLERERENLRLALGWCAERDDAVRGLRLATRAIKLWQGAGPPAEGHGWLRRFLGRAPPDLPAWLRLRALWGTGWLANRVGDVATARACAREGLPLAEAGRDDRALVLMLFLAAVLARRDGDLAASQAAAERALAVARRIGATGAEETALIWLGNLAQARGDAAQAAARYEAALVLPPGVNRQWALRSLGHLALEAGRLAEAAARLRESLAMTWSRRSTSNTLATLGVFAALARERQQWERAARLLGAMDVGMERLGDAGGESRRERERTLAASREQLGEPAFAAAYAAGRELALEQAVAYALEEDGDA